MRFMEIVYNIYGSLIAVMLRSKSGAKKRKRASILEKNEQDLLDKILMLDALEEL